MTRLLDDQVAKHARIDQVIIHDENVRVSRCRGNAIANARNKPNLNGWQAAVAAKAAKPSSCFPHSRNVALAARMERRLEADRRIARELFNAAVKRRVAETAKEAA